MQGVPLGHPAFVAAWLDRHLASQREILRRLVAYVPDRLAAAQMLSWCIVPRIAHILRALPPPATADFATAFDDACVACFTAIAAPDFAQAGLPPTADTIMRLKLRDGGFDTGGQHRSAPAAYVAAWVTARKLIRRLAPSLAPHLPTHLHVRPAALGDPQPFDPAAVPLTPEADDPAAGIPAPIRALHDAIAQLHPAPPRRRWGTMQTRWTPGRRAAAGGPATPTTTSQSTRTASRSRHSSHDPPTTRSTLLS
jgi:hypothetical protein